MILIFCCEVCIRQVALLSNSPAVVFFVEKQSIENSKFFGLPYEEGLKSLTLNSAKILGIDDRVGSLEIGKDATLIITDGDPFSFDTQVLQAFIKGRSVDLNDRHKMLRDKYNQKY